jgi:hypothetical protein
MATEGNGAPPLNGAAAELERRRALDRERNKRHRERVRLRMQGPAPSEAAPSNSQAAGAAPVHDTRPIDALGGDPTQWQREAPEVSHEPEVTPTDTEGAKKFAALVALVFRMALDDAIPRYDLGRFAGELGAGELGAGELAAARAAAVRFVYEHAERCALTHGFGLTVPWEDEIVTLAAGGGSILYLAARITGRLDRQRRGQGARPPVGGDPASRPAHAQDDDEPDSAYGAIRVDDRMAS